MGPLIFPNSPRTGIFEQFFVPLNDSWQEYSQFRELEPSGAVEGQTKGVAIAQNSRAVVVRAGLDKKLVIINTTSTHSSGDQHVRNKRR
jgi:hypothetical protein